MEVQLLLLHVYLLMSSLWSFMSCSSAILGVASPPSLAKPNCQSHCGGIEIPYPFGIGPDCYLPDNRGYQILCDNSSYNPKPLLNLTDSIQLEVLEISLAGTLKINSPIFFLDCPNKPRYLQTPYLLPDLTSYPFLVSMKNKFTSVSCGMIAELRYASGFDGAIAVCLSVCEGSDNTNGIIVNNSCGGVNCCQTSLRYAAYGDLIISFAQFPVNGQEEAAGRQCKYAFLADQEWFTSNSTNTSAIAQMDYVPMVLDWSMLRPRSDFTKHSMNRNCESVIDTLIGTCSCSRGYQGNPYLQGGCQDINECEDPTRPNICGPGSICINKDGGYKCDAQQLQPQPQHQATKLGIIVPCGVIGVLFVIIGTWWLHRVIKKRNSIKRKQKFFRRNGGLLLEKQLSSGEVNVEKIKLFNAKELEKATDRFNIDRVVGEGGQGTVYKGMLADGRIVAVKKSKIGEGKEVSQFITEIVILSQINHRNVVKILGCCLESEVPLLVYEFLPNGTLSQYIQSQDEDFPLTWEARLRVGTEVAGAISYLHSSASNPIYHRDIKSSNILLDDKYRAKIADFGTSRSVSIDQTHLTMTHVEGTYGYLDPEYFQSNLFTDKSDVYSFGVVLAELLTGQKPRSQDGRQNWRNLATIFTVSLEENRLFDILDAEVMKGGKKEEIMAVANLAKRCLNMKGKKRPAMKEIAAEVEGILMASRSSDAQQHVAEVDCVQTEIAEACWDAISTSTGSHLDTSSSLDGQPLMAFKSI